MGVMSASGLGKRFDGRWIFRGVEFTLSVGDVLVVLGRNGSGKSTLLRILAGLLPQTEGRVERTNIGYSALDLAMWPHLTGQEHVDLAKRLRGWGEEGLLDSYGLGDAKDRAVRAYSTGMRARLKLVLATMHRPDVLLLDEPTASMDEAGRTLVDRLVGEQRRHGAVVLATNDPLDRRLATHEIALD